MNNKNKNFTAWVQDYTDDLLNWTKIRVGEQVIAEDLVQETFLAAYRGYENFENRSAPKSWLIAILNRKIADHFRNNEKLRYVHTDFSEEKQANAISGQLFNEKEGWVQAESPKLWDTDEHLLDNAEFNTVMAACMDDLPSKWRYLVTSKYIDEKNTNEICQEMNVTPSNYWQIIHRAKLLLKACIEKYWK